jgi:hypothetical protein
MGVLAALGPCHGRDTAFCNLPLRIWGALGATIASISLLYGLYRIIRYFIHGVDVPGFESIIVAVAFLGGIQLLCLGVLGGYISHIFDEVKRRPLYIVRRTYGIDGSNQQVATNLHAELNDSKR